MEAQLGVGVTGGIAAINQAALDGQLVGVQLGVASTKLAGFDPPPRGDDHLHPVVLVLLNREEGVRELLRRWQRHTPGNSP